MTDSIRRAMWHLVLFAMLPAAMARGQRRAIARDWPMYNHDLAGSRFNPGETTIGRENAGQLVEKWRFPARGSDQKIGVIHATPTVVGGYVYFGTATDPTFYKLSPDGKLCWAYHKPTRAGQDRPGRVGGGAEAPAHDFRFQSSAEGIMTSALVTEDSVYFGDLGGWFYALDRETGAERWRIDARASDFPAPSDQHVLRLADPRRRQGHRRRRGA